MRAAIFVDAPVARPLGLEARRARRVPRTVEVGKVPAHKILVRLRRPHLYEPNTQQESKKKKKRKITSSCEETRQEETHGGDPTTTPT